MLSFVWSLGAFIVALGILVAVHEWGHFYIARRCGVFVERFSIGFGRALWRKKSRSGTEYVIAAIPLGGYVRMLDERVDDVPPQLKQQAFNNKPVLQRMAIIAAGPGVNFVFAVVALFLMYLIGLQTVKPIVKSVAPASIASQANFPENVEVVAIGERQTPDWEAVNLELMSYIGAQDIPITVEKQNGYREIVRLAISDWNFAPDKESSLQSLGLVPYRPDPTLEIAFVGKDTPAERAGLRVGDTLVSISEQKLTNWQELVDIVSEKPGQMVTLTVDRDGQTRVVNATIASQQDENTTRGYLGVSPVFEAWPQGYVFTHQYGVIDALTQALDKTWRLMVLSVEMIGKLLTGDVSVKNLSGPISIAQGAGISAGYGLAYFLSFLALISVNLGIINLLPLPMLDGGHLVYFAIEWLTGKPVPEQVQEWGFRIGGALLLAIMSIAIFNDIARLG